MEFEEITLLLSFFLWAAIIIWLHRWHRNRFVNYVTMRALNDEPCRIEDVFMCRSCEHIFEANSPSSHPLIDDSQIMFSQHGLCPKCGETGSETEDNFIPATHYLKTSNHLQNT